MHDYQHDGDEHQNAVAGERTRWFGRCGLWLACVLLAACGGGLVPVLNVQNAPVVLPSSEPASPSAVRAAIVRALAQREWRIDREGPDGFIATVTSRGQSATVHIQYDDHAYSIAYVDSSPGMKFNGQRIHRRYNDWIARLSRTIRANLLDPNAGATLVAEPGPDPVPPEAAPAAEQVPVHSEPAPATAHTSPTPAPPAPSPPPGVAPPGAADDDAPPPPPPKTATPRK
ncbi:MAG: hypothetical protein ABW321_09335 [Polyangiales bacterium]